MKFKDSYSGLLREGRGGERGREGEVEADGGGGGGWGK